jgi:hypothetical protein
MSLFSSHFIYFSDGLAGVPIETSNAPSPGADSGGMARALQDDALAQNGSPREDRPPPANTAARQSANQKPTSRPGEAGTRR